MLRNVSDISPKVAFDSTALIIKGIRLILSFAACFNLFKLDFIPVVNENDTIATSEIKFGDNDRLAAQVALTSEADLLILLSDIDGLYEESEFQEEVQSGKKLKLPDGGVSRLNKKDKKKGSSSWKRNENISFMAIEDSQFLCENDPNHSTFISRKSGKQFMEAHHLIPMEFYDHFQYSIDVPENIISLCPNCHSLFHYSENNFRNKIIEKFYNKRRDLLKKRKIDIDLNKLKGYYNDKNNA